MKNFKIRDLKIGKFLKQHAPTVLDAVDDIFPPVKILTALVENVTLSAEQKKEFQQLLQEYELELYKLEIQDRESARSRQVEIARTGKSDMMFYITGIVGLGAFVAIVAAIILGTVSIENKELFIHMVGIIEGVALTIFNYHYGTSKSSSDKTKMLKKDG